MIAVLALRLVFRWLLAPAMFLMLVIFNGELPLAETMRSWLRGE